MAALFEFDRVGVRRDDTDLLTDVTLTVGDHGITAIIGPSGSGKSTLLRCCNQLEVPTTGTIRYRGTDLRSLDPLEHRRRVAMVFQTPTTFPGSALDNLRVAAPGLTEDRARELLQRVGLDPALASRAADRLSGGEAQRLVVARALATEPEVLLADEPTSALDHDSTMRLESVARDLAREGVPILWVSHDRAQVERLADFVVVIRDGTVVASGRASQFEMTMGDVDDL